MKHNPLSQLQVYIALLLPLPQKKTTVNFLYLKFHVVFILGLYVSKF